MLVIEGVLGRDHINEKGKTHFESRWRHLRVRREMNEESLGILAQPFTARLDVRSVPEESEKERRDGREGSMVVGIPISAESFKVRSDLGADPRVL